MFENLVASTAVRERPLRFSLLSIACHLAVAVITVAATHAVATPADPPARLKVHADFLIPRTAPLRQVTVTPRASAPASDWAVIAVPMISPVGLPAVDVDLRAGDALQQLLKMPDHDPFTPQGPPLYPVPSDSILSELAVDEPVRWLSGSKPEYPKALRAAGIEGAVTLQFIVDSAGRVERGSVKVLSSTHAAFEAEAVAAVTSGQFAPARLRGRPVRQRVQQGVRFALDLR